MWLQPNTLQEFLHLKWEHPEARVVVGNTEVGQSFSPKPWCLMLIHPATTSLTHCVCFSGIEVKFKNMVYPVILAPAFIPELNTVTHTEDGEYCHQTQQPRRVILPPDKRLRRRVEL